MLRFAGQLGVCWAELGPYYDSPNEAVMPAVAIVAPVPQPLPQPWARAARRLVFVLRSPAIYRCSLLPPPPSGAIMKRR
jgi:hypothetical protein